MASQFNTLHVVKVVNTHEDEILHIPYLGQVMQIPPSESRTVPWDAVCSIFGNPFIQNRPNQPERNDVWHAMRALWGFAIGYDVETEAQRDKQPAARREMASSWEVKKPKYEIYTIDTDERILMVLDDPAGALPNPGLTGAAEPEQHSPAAQSQMISDLQAQVAALTNLVQSLARPADDAVSSVPVGVPEGSSVPAAGSVEIPQPVAINPADTPTPRRK